MRKALSYFFIIIGIGLMVISTSRSIMQVISDKRSTVTGSLGVHNAKGGDLVNMAFLDKETKFLERINYDFKRPADTTNKNIDLYVYGDSYIMEIPDSAFAHVNKFHFGRRDYTDLTYNLNPHKKNILIIENGERFVRTYFKYNAIFDHIKKEAAAFSSRPIHHFEPLHAGLLNIKFSEIFNPNINQNLEYNLFNYNFINWIRQLKAGMNYTCFNRVSGDVALSGNGAHLFLRQTVAAHGPLSIYEDIEPQEFAQLLVKIDTIYKHYKKEGFDEVYFSIIPNPATILQSPYYNGLIPTLEKQAAALGIPFIDIYKKYSSHPDPASLYTAGDTHWNNNGCQVWIQAVNEALSKQSGRP